jgi:hypothetical protein
VNTTEQTKAAIDAWTKDENKQNRYDILYELYCEARLENAFSEVPKIHFDLMDYDKFLINAIALGKIRELRRIADK